MSNPATVAVVIVNHQSLDWVFRCLASLDRFCRSDLLKIVVDNSPAEDTDRLRRARPDVRVLRQWPNLGFAAGCNYGIRYALRQGVEAVLLLNPDTEVFGPQAADNNTDSLIQPLLDALRLHPELGIVAPTVLRLEQPGEVLYAGGRLSWWRGGPRHLLSRPGRDDRFRFTDFVSGCAMLIRAETLRQVGPMDEAYFLYFEDADYALRCRSAGWDVAWVPTARILHHESCSIERDSAEHVYLYSRNRLWFLRRWSPALPKILYASFTLLLKLPVSFFLLGPVLGFAFSRGVWHGLTRRPAHESLQDDWSK